MTEFGNVTATVRHNSGKGAARTLRRSGQVPAIIYGGAADNISLALSPHELNKATDPERSWNTLYNLTIKEEGKADIVQAAVVSDVQVHAIRREVTHIDFMRVDPDQEVIRKIPVRFEGRPKGVVAGGKLKTFRRVVKVAAKPANIPVELLVETTEIEAGQSLRMKDVSLESGRLVEDPEARLLFIDMPKAKAEGEEGEEEEAK